MSFIFCLVGGATLRVLGVILLRSDSQLIFHKSLASGVVGGDDMGFHRLAAAKPSHGASGVLPTSAMILEKVS